MVVCSGESVKLMMMIEGLSGGRPSGMWMGLAKRNLVRSFTTSMTASNVSTVSSSRGYLGYARGGSCLISLGYLFAAVIGLFIMITEAAILLWPYEGWSIQCS